MESEIHPLASFYDPFMTKASEVMKLLETLSLPAAQDQSVRSNKKERTTVVRGGEEREKTNDAPPGRPRIDSDDLALPPCLSSGLPSTGLVSRVGLRATRETFLFFFFN